MRFAGLIDIFDRWGATAGLVAAAVAYCVFIALPYGKETAQLRRETAQRRAFIADAARLVAETERLDSEGRATVDYVNAWRAASPDSADAGAFFGEVHQAVRRAGVSVTRFEPQSPVALSTIEQRPIALVLEGPHADISAALVNIEKLPATIWVKDVVITPSREPAGHVRFESKLVVFADKATNSD